MADNLAGALAELQANLPAIAKSQTATVRSDKGSYSYSYANLAEVTHAVMPLLGKCGLAFTAKPTAVDGRFVLAYSLLHTSGEREDGEYPLPTSGTPQQIGSAITYARRYTLCSVTGVAPEQDDDDAAALQDLRPGRATVQRRERPESREERTERAETRPVRRQMPAEPGPPLPGEDTPSESTITGQQMAKLRAQLGDLGIGGKDDRDKVLALVSSVVGREVASSKDLTKAEASHLIDRLEQDGAVLVAQVLDDEADPTTEPGWGGQP